MTRAFVCWDRQKSQPEPSDHTETHFIKCKTTIKGAEVYRMEEILTLATDLAALSL